MPSMPLLVLYISRILKSQLLICLHAWENSRPQIVQQEYHSRDGCYMQDPAHSFWAFAAIEYSVE